AMLAVVVLLLVVVGLAAVPPTTYSFGIIKRTCAPWDGAAIGLTLTPKRAQCDRISEPFLMITVYDLPVHAGQTVKLNSSDQVHGGQSSLCASKEKCVPAESGTVTFDEYREGVSAKGHYQLKFHDGRELSGSFEVTWCKIQEFCG